MIFVNHYAIRPLIPKTILIQHCRVEIIAFSFMLFHRDCFFNFCCLFRQRFSAAYLLKLFLLPQHVHTTLFIGCDKPELARFCLSNPFPWSKVFVETFWWRWNKRCSTAPPIYWQLACWHTDISWWIGGQPWRLSPFHRRRHCWCAHTSLPANF